ncbi:glycoside hydrolase family 3 N-terminal domain-containing protein [Bacteroides salyersiae]|uniref:glycoside hydrolase family 3 N-terminal domain-containing protein n=1 Tax=Bacteroides salyersiae TaxID=291644 RepID=UPI003F633545
MNKLVSTFIISSFTAAMGVSVFAADDGGALYLDAGRPVEQRVKDLMSRMTLEEKVGQMCQWVGLEHMRTASQDLTVDELSNNTARGFYPGITEEDVRQMTIDGKVGSFLHVLTVKEANQLQELAMKSRLKIPLIIGIDAIHGNAQVVGTTAYPTSIGQASMFDVGLVEEICRQTALEMRATGSQWTFNPNVEVARDPRWGRVGETFGEDPYLVSLLGVASVRGYQGDGFGKAENVLACAKHFIGGSQPINGTNGSPTDISERTLREVFLPPFKATVDAGVYSFMTAHNELNGVPCHANPWLMEDILRKEWGFDGFIVSDWMDIEHIHDLHRTAVDNKDAFYQSVDAGMDMHMHGPEFYERVIELVKEGKLTEARIDESCRKILAAKFRLGLFEKSFTDEKAAKSVLFNEKHQATALEAARKSIVLLTNDGILPLDEAKYKNVFVTGMNADNQTILGDWALTQPDENVITVLEGLKLVSPDTKFSFADLGWNIGEMDKNKVEQAAKQAAKADLAIVAVGEYSLRTNWYDKTCGEDCDRSDINLAGLQQELVESILATGVPTVVVLVNGRQLGVEWIAGHANALVEAWEPGSLGGQAIAEILYGKVNPSGKLPVTVPRHVGQIQMIYNHKPSMYFHPYAIGESTPLFYFGYGLSYTEYAYSDLTVSSAQMSGDGSVEVSVKVTNTGTTDGEEIVQLYIRDLYSSATRPVKELKDFRRVPLRAGETKTVSFILPAGKLAFYDKKMDYTVEPGDYEIMVGASSRDEDLMKRIVNVK